METIVLNQQISDFLDECRYYNLKVVEKTNCILIDNRISKWILDYRSNTIILYHKNLKGNKKIHIQLENINNIVTIAKYVYKHDKYCYGYCKSKVEKLKKIK